MLFLTGEWPLATAAVIFTFLVAGSGVFGLGWWVLRGDRLNHRAEPGGHYPGESEEPTADEG